MDELEDKILKDIEKTGFVTELKTVSLLNDKGWKTSHSYTYEDHDEHKSREIDIFASKVHFVKEVGFRLIIYLVIEAKKAKNPWIIFTTEREFSSLGWRIMHSSSNSNSNNTIINGNVFSTTILELDGINSNSPRENISRMGKAFHEFGKQPSEKPTTYGALISAGKAAKYLCDSYKPEETFNPFQPDQITDLSIYLPTVVLDGLLDGVYNDTEGKIKVHKENYMPIEMRYSSPNYKEGLWDINFFQDLITFEYLENHLDNIDMWIKSMLDKFSKNLKEVGKLPYIPPAF